MYCKQQETNEYPAVVKQLKGVKTLRNFPFAKKHGSIEGKPIHLPWGRHPFSSFVSFFSTTVKEVISSGKISKSYFFSTSTSEKIISKIFPLHTEKPTQTPFKSTQCTLATSKASWLDGRGTRKLFHTWNNSFMSSRLPFLSHGQTTHGRKVSVTELRKALTWQQGCHEAGRSRQPEGWERKESHD